MQKLATIFRALQLIAHNAHNTAHGPNFFADHEAFGDIYAAAEKAYDAVVERAIGLGEEIDLVKIQTEAAKIAEAAGVPPTNDDAFRVIQQTEMLARAEIAAAVAGGSDGTQNLLQGLADESEQRAYLIGQRLR